MANLLVTGGAGFIGVNFVRYWREKNPGDSVVVYDALTYAGNKASLDGVDGITLIEADICDAGAVDTAMSQHAIDTIVHFAAESHVDRSITGPDAFITTNIVGTHTLLKAAKIHWLDKKKAHRFHHVSTDEVYGSLEPNDPAFSEATAYAPNSPYSASKAGSDHLVRAYHHTFGLETTISNCSNNYGPYQFPEKLMPLFLLNALNGRALPIYGDGMNVRDWLYVEDHCYGIDLILKGGTPGEVYNIGGGAELTNLAVIDHLCAAVDSAFAQQPDLAKRFPDAPAARGIETQTLKTFVTDRAGHDRRYAIDCSKIETQLNYRAQRTFEQGFRDLVSWYLANENWWKPLLKT